jgi:hypothetical protein
MVLMAMIGLTFCGFSQGGQTETDEKSRVTFLVVSSFGFPVPEYDLAVWRSEEDRLPVGILRSGTGPLDLSPGRYIVTVWASTCDASIRWVEVSEPEELVVIGLTYMSSGASVTRDRLYYVPVGGTVRGVARTGGELLWLRMRSVYGDFNREVRIDHQGRFTMSEVPNGDYLLSVFQGGELIHTEWISPRDTDGQDRQIVVTVPAMGKE